MLFRTANCMEGVVEELQLTRAPALARLALAAGVDRKRPQRVWRIEVATHSTLKCSQRQWKSTKSNQPGHKHAQRQTTREAAFNHHSWQPDIIAAHDK